MGTSDRTSAVDGLRLAVFDCDGTLVDSQRHIVGAMHASWEAHGLPVPEAQAVRRVVGLSLQEAIARLGPELEPALLASLTQCYAEHWLAMRQRGELTEHLYPGAIDALDAMEGAGWILAVATGKSRRGLLATLDSHGLTDRFVSLQTADTGRGKPHPDMLERAMTETGVPPDCTVMIGDTTYDVEMARHAGTYAVGVAWGYHDPRELQAAGAHRLVNDFSELPTVLQVFIEEARP